MLDRFYQKLGGKASPAMQLGRPRGRCRVLRPSGGHVLRASSACALLLHCLHVTSGRLPGGETVTSFVRAFFLFSIVQTDGTVEARIFSIEAAATFMLPT